MDITVIRKASDQDMKGIMELITSVFNGEQAIPAELIPIPDELTPRWWCAVEGGEITGSIALYQEHGEWHIGRFAVSPNRRGASLGSRLFETAVRDIFKSDIEVLYCEARDTTVHIILKHGGKIIGEAVPFFKGNVTPMFISKDSFEKT